MNKRNLILCLIVFLLTFGIRLYFIGQKQGFFIDEIFTRTAVVGKFQAIKKMCNEPSVYFSAGSIKKWIFGKPETSTGYDLKQIWQNNYNDTSHPNLYFFLIRIGLDFFDYSPNGFLIFGCGLNLLFFTFSFFIMMKILLRLFGDNKLVPIGLAVAFLSTGTISMTLFIRPYEMQILGILFITYVYLIYYDKLKNNLSLFNFKDVCILIFSLTFIYLTGYFLAIYAAILGVSLLYKTRTDKKNFLVILFSAFFALLPALLIFPHYFQFLNDDRFYDAGKNYKNIMDLLPHLTALKDNILDFIFYRIIIFASIFIFIFYKDNGKLINKHCLTLIIFALIWEFIISITVSYTSIRYFAPAFPVLSLIILLLISKTKDKYQNTIAILFILLYCATALFSFKQECGQKTIYKVQPNRILPYGAKLENLWELPIINFNSNIPVYIYTINPLEKLNLFPRFNDRQNLIVRNIATYLRLETIDDFDYYLLYFDNPIYDKNYFEVKYIGRFVTFPTFHVRRIKFD